MTEASLVVFGTKAQTVSVEGFIRGPLFNHLGITTDPLSDDAKARLPVPSTLDGEDPRLETSQGNLAIRRFSSGRRTFRTTHRR